MVDTQKDELLATQVKLADVLTITKDIQILNQKNGFYM